MAVHFSVSMFLTSLLNARIELSRAGVGQKFGTWWNAGCEDFRRCEIRPWRWALKLR
jgi:hypothetical protein